jgi:hypothetical protein
MGGVRAVQANASRICFLIKIGIVKARHDDVFHRIARRASGNELAYQQAGNGRIAIRVIEIDAALSCLSMDPTQWQADTEQEKGQQAQVAHF